MDQIKYLLYACLMLFVLVFAGLFIQTVFSNEIIASPPTLIDNPTPDQSGKSSANSKGQMLFQQNCQSCHALDKNLTGPALRAVEERGPWKDRANLVKWIKNPAKFIPTTPYTAALQKQYGQIMPSFSQLSDEEIHAILDYITTVVPSSAIAVRCYFTSCICTSL